MWDGTCPPIAVDQSLKYRLIHRYREQAPSHIFTAQGLRLSASLVTQGFHLVVVALYAVELTLNQITNTQ